MKSQLLTLLVLASALMARAATYRDTVLADNPVGYWRLGDPADSRATNSGSLGAAGNGTTFQNVTFGVPGALNSDPDTAVNFDGNQAKINVPYSSALNTARFTVEAWAKVTTDSTGHRSPVASRDDPPQRGFIFYAAPNNQWQFWTGTGAQVGWNVVGGAAAEPEVWAHLVGVYDGTNKFFYVNGVLVGANRSAFTPNGSRVLRIGASATESPVGDFFFNGDVDEVAVYPAVLSPERVVAHYASGAGAPPDASVTPGFAAPPLPLDRFKGESATFSVLATGSLPLRYQWQRDNVDLPGATSFTLVVSNLQPANGGAYTVVVSNDAGSTTSDPVTLTVADVSKPVITSQPASRTVLPGATASFSVVASGSTVFSYQWQHNGQALDKATNATLNVTNVQTQNLGSYKVTVKNAAGSSDSDIATLSIHARPAGSYVDVVKADGPVGYWRLDETEGEIALDQIAGNSGDILNGVTLGVPGAIAGDANLAANFSSGDRQKIDVPWTEALNPPQFSMEVWARMTGGAGVHRSPLTSRADSPQRGYIFYCEPGDIWQFWSGKGDDSGWDNIPGPRAEINQWAHLVGTYDGTIKRFYVNGVMVGTSTAAFAPNDVNALRFGGGATEGPGAFFFEGDVDEPAIYNKALTDEQVISHYLAGISAMVTPAVLTVARVDGNLVLSWAAGSLELASAVNGPWTTLAGANSPVNVTPDQSARFYRLR